MKKAIKDLTLGELITMVKEHNCGSCDDCPLFPVLSLPCDDICMLDDYQIEKIEKSFEQEIEVKENE